MATNLTLRGVQELRDALRSLTPELVREASVIVQGSAHTAARQIGARYPVGRTGNLKNGLRVETRGDGVSATAIVRSTARHAYLFERGSKPRRWANGKSTGVMPAADVLIPIAIEQRRAMTSALIELVQRAGFKVSTA